MGALGLMLLMSALVMIPALDVADDPATDTETDETDAPQEPISATVTEGGPFAGTAGDDTIVLDVTGGRLGGDVPALTLATGDGDDTITGDVSGIEVITGGTAEANVDAGAGDDSLAIGAARYAEIDGGEGNDTLTIGFIEIDGEVTGGPGDDSITAGSGGDFYTARGGDGNDTLASGSTAGGDFFVSANVGFEGEAGDDVINLVGPGSNGTGYFEVGNGGPGNDTIRMSAAMPRDLFDYDDFAPFNATGGAGADTFILDIEDAVMVDEDERFPLGNDVPWEADNPNTPTDALSVGLMRITDFDRTEDVLLVDADAVTEGGVLAEARLELSDTGVELVLRYESDVQSAIEAVIELAGATDLTWADVQFIGTQTPNLIDPIT